MVLVLKKLFAICGRFVTVYFVLILPNVLGKNKFDVHENERVVETHFSYEWFHIRLVWAQEKSGENYDNLDFDEFSGSVTRYYNASYQH